MKRTYTDKEQKTILKELGITALNNMVNSQQAALIMSKRAEIETGTPHSYGDDAVRWRVKKGKLKVAMPVNKRLNLYNVSDVFALELEPQKWHEKRGKTKTETSPEIGSQTY